MLWIILTSFQSANAEVFRTEIPKPSQPEAGALLQPPSSKWLAWLAGKGPGTTFDGPKALASWNLTDLRWLLRWRIWLTV